MLDLCQAQTVCRSLTGWDRCSFIVIGYDSWIQLLHAWKVVGTVHNIESLVEGQELLVPLDRRCMCSSVSYACRWQPKPEV